LQGAILARIEVGYRQTAGGTLHFALSLRGRVKVQPRSKCILNNLTASAYIARARTRAASVLWVGADGLRLPRKSALSNYNLPACIECAAYPNAGRRGSICGAHRAWVVPSKGKHVLSSAHCNYTLTHIFAWLTLFGVICVRRPVRALTLRSDENRAALVL
jgi:hypothetical protein